MTLIYLEKYQIKKQSSMNNQPVIVEKVFDTTVQKVWDALTDNKQLKQWYFVLPEFRAETGFGFQFLGGKEDGTQYLHLCKVTKVVPGKILAYSWKFDGYLGTSFVTFELAEVGDKTKLTVTHSGLETFIPFNHDFSKEEFLKGWTAILNTSLKDFLAKD